MATNKLAKASAELEVVRDIVSNSEVPDMRVGDLYIDREGHLFRIDSMEVEERIDWDASEKQWKEKNPGKWYSSNALKEKDWILYSDVKVSYSKADLYDDEEFNERYSSLYLIAEKSKKDWVKVTGDKEKFETLAKDIIDGKAEMPDLHKEMGADGESGTGLIHVSSKEYLMVAQQVALEKSKHFMAIQHFVQRELERKKDHLRGIVFHFQGMVAAFQKQVEKIQRIIGIIELYLGIGEEIVQFQEGEKAPIDEPVTYRQRVMYMDEEVGDPRLDPYGRNEGLDFRNIEAFDAWLCANGNYKKVMPELKSICAFKVRRETKRGHYTVNPFIAAAMDHADKKTYVLIRNGDNLYRIWADMEVAERLFPHKKELMELQDEVLKSENSGSYDHDRAKEKLETDVERYQRQFILMQGLVDRTEILHPLKEVFKLSELDLDKTKLVRFIYDDGPALMHKGHVPFKEWMKKMNSTIGEGSRIVITGGAEYEEERFDQRFHIGRKGKYGLPESPDPGLYTVFLKKCKNKYGYANPKGYGEKVHELLTIRYNPKDKVQNSWDRWDRGHERKNSISYNIMTDDDFILNFDDVTSKEIDYYLDSRLDRREYITMMPVLWEVREHKRKEEEEEQDFLLMLIAPFAAKGTQEQLLEAAKEEMTWWKTKNKWKRNLKKDDAKAFRMIGARLKNGFK